MHSHAAVSGLDYSDKAETELSKCDLNIKWMAAAIAAQCRYIAKAKREIVAVSFVEMRYKYTERSIAPGNSFGFICLRRTFACCSDSDGFRAEPPLVPLRSSTCSFSLHARFNANEPPTRRRDAAKQRDGLGAAVDRSYPEESGSLSTGDTFGLQFSHLSESLEGN